MRPDVDTRSTVPPKGNPMHSRLPASRAVRAGWLAPAAALGLLAAACNTSVVEPVAPPPVASDTVRNVFASLPASAVHDTVRDLRADTGAAEVRPWTYFRLDGKGVVPATGDTSAWDLAFRATAIRVRGGVQLANQPYDSVTLAPDAGYAENANAPTWYDYNPDTHLITPKANTTLVVRTTDGKYAKIEVRSYYKGSPATPDAEADTSRYYTFRYLLQKDGSRNLVPTAEPRTFFSLRTGTTVDSAAGWDLAFRNTTISVNGSALVLTGVNFDTLAQAPESGYANGTVPTWYDYLMDGSHTILPKLGAVIVVRTADGKYAKIQVMSYYKDAPAAPVGTVDEPRYYTFRYVLQNDGSRNFEGNTP